MAPKKPRGRSTAVRTTATEEVIENGHEPMEVADPEAGGDAPDQAVDAVPIIRKDFNPADFGEIEIPAAPEKVATYAADGPRLMITHIVNENFKSYAGVRTLGPFHKSFTAIVGPNGSGKSNVIDSMLFVFGYRANKIRSKKISVLIHNSDQHQNVEGCSVSVHFQKIIDTGIGDDDYEVIPSSKFVVSRTAFRDNSSHYCVDGKRVTYKEVAALLRSSGIDLDHNRFLILQGEVEQIAMMKPKGQTEHDEGMLEFLEDIIGSSRFMQPIDVLAKRVEELNEMRGEKLNRVKAVEKDKNNLEGPKNEALEYLHMENDIGRQKNTLYQKYIHEFTVTEEQAVVKRDRVKDSMKELTEKLDELANAQKEKGKEHKQVHKNYEKLVQQCEEKKAEFTEFEKEDVKCREDLKHSKANAKKLDKNLEQEKKKAEELMQVPDERNKAMEALQEKLNKLEEDKKVQDEKLKEVMDGLKSETQGLQDEKEKQEEKLMELQKSVNETKSKMDVATSELELYLSNQQREKTRLETIHQNLIKNNTTLAHRKQEVTEIESKLPNTERALVQAEKDLSTAKETEERMSEKLRDLRVKVDAAKSSMQASRSRGKVLEALMAQKQSGKLSGIYGRLGDLGAIDNKYDVAISTACGPLDNIVVDTIDTAQKCVEYLKKSGVGAATFIGLDKMEKWKGYINKKITTPDNVPRLFDLVKVNEEKYKLAFYFALRDTLVANDLDHATRIAYGKNRFRVVTLQGQLIDQSGTMSGGGKTVCKGRMGSSVVAAADDYTPLQMKHMEEEVDRLVSQLQQCRANEGKLDQTVHEMKKSVSLLTNNRDKFKMQLGFLAEEEKTLKSQVSEQEERVKAAAPDEKQLKELENKVNNFKKDYYKAASAAEKVQVEVKKLHDQIMEISGAKMKAAQSRVDAISKQIDQVVGQITKNKVDVKTSQRNLKKAQDKVASLEEDIQENKNKVEELEKQFKELEEKATKVLESYQQSQEKIKEFEDQLSEINIALEKIEHEATTLKKDNIEVKHELEECESLVKDSMIKKKHWKKEIGRLTLHKIERTDSEELPTLSMEDISSVEKEKVQYAITVLEEKLAQMKPNMAAIEEYRKKEEVYLQRATELEHITEFRNQQRSYHEDLRKQRLDEFMSGFTIITNKLKEMYRMITLGGDAELELVDSLDPFSEGIVFSVRPPNKSWKNISNLSGGEKTLSSLALVFALHHYKPTPLYVMDEIDAALDFRNVSIVGNYIKERTRNAQFIIISLRNNMFELADRLVGIYKTYDCTKSVTINPKKIATPIALQEVDINA